MAPKLPREAALLLCEQLQLSLAMPPGPLPLSIGQQSVLGLLAWGAGSTLYPHFEEPERAARPLPPAARLGVQLRRQPPHRQDQVVQTQASGTT